MARLNGILANEPIKLEKTLANEDKRLQCFRICNQTLSSKRNVHRHKTIQISILRKNFQMNIKNFCAKNAIKHSVKQYRAKIM